MNKKTINFTSSEEVFEWLSVFINLERGQKPKSFRIDRMHALCELAGNPHKCAPSIHIAGSKGKGSVTSMLAAMLTAAGYRAARYMSPHVSDIRERICLGSSFFDEDVYCAAGDELRRITDVLLPDIAKLLPQAASLFDPAASGGCEPTYWELLTLLFFLCARYAKCDAMVVETGLGGRLDSTNVIDPLVSVITLIELEHTAFLGNTIAEVAGEKAGIIKQGKPVIIAKQCGEALEVFIKTANDKNSRLSYLPEIAELSNIKITPQGTEFNLTQKNIDSKSPHKGTKAQRTVYKSLSIPICGKVQAENAALAIAALKIALLKINEKAIRKGLKNLEIPARFEKISEQPFIIDGAHTTESFSLCVETFRSLYGSGGVLIFGCAADKDAVSMSKAAYSHFSKILITTPGTFKASDPAHVYETFVKTAGEEKVSLLKDTQDAVKYALDYSDKNNLPVLGTGSFYLAAEIRKIIFSINGGR